jgi:hypothetical protein
VCVCEREGVGEREVGGEWSGSVVRRLGRKRQRIAGPDCEWEVRVLVWRRALECTRFGLIFVVFLGGGVWW